MKKHENCKQEEGAYLCQKVTKIYLINTLYPIY